MAFKKISIWGATGSIGTQTLDVVSRFREQFRVIVLTTHSNIPLVYRQAEQFHPETVVVTGGMDDAKWENKFKRIGVRLSVGKEGLSEVADGGGEDLIVNALVGAVGLDATLRAIKRGVHVALANKEVLVMAGEIVTTEARTRGVRLIPIDSEHSAIFQCLTGEAKESIQRILLTASGGPFLHRDYSGFCRITVEEALAHPNWSMGKKVTIDSATLMNKGLEVIEAHWLFGMEPERVDVIIHPQSVIHSMVEFVDGSIKAQMGVPDMRIPIAYALTFPDRRSVDYGRVDFSKEHRFEFFQPDTKKFPALLLAYEAVRKGGTAPAVLNGADEAAVHLFLSGRIQFNQIAESVEWALEHHHVVSTPTIEDILVADQWARNAVMEQFNPNG